MARLTIGFKTSPQGVDWPTLEASWAAAGELDVFDAGWLNDHLTDPRQERGGASLEPLTLLAALAHLVPGKRLGVAVLSNTFRHPAVLAKQATVLDLVSGGRVILGLGAGWHEGEHEAFGIPLPPPGERFDRFESSLRVLRALFSAGAAGGRGVSLDDPFVSLRGATNEPGPTGVGPAVWLGVQRRRGIGLAARYADGWVQAGDRANDVAQFRAIRERLLEALDAEGRDPAAFEVAGQVFPAGGGARPSTASEREAVETGLAMARAGATHLVLGVAGAAGPGALRRIASEVAEPIREAVG